jgi:ATP-dependent Clp protease ATP-binding subunit ClpC
MTSNVGSQELGILLERKTMGFGSAPEDRRGNDSRKTVLAAARNKFPMEFLNRFDETLVFASLERRHLEAIFDKFLAEIHDRAMRMAGVPLLIKVSTEARDLILERGTDLAFGARPLRRAVEAGLVDPLSRLIGSNRVSAGDVVDVERNGDELVFYRRAVTEPTFVV